MRNIVIIIILVLLGFTVLICNAYPSSYVVVNPDGSIHCFETVPSEVLTGGKQRFDLSAMPEKHHMYYEWKGGDLSLRSSVVVQEEIDAVADAYKRSQKIDAEVRLQAIEALEIKDPNEDYNVEKQKHINTINQKKKGVI